MTNFTTKKHTNFKMDGFQNFILEKLQENDQTIKQDTLCGNVSVDYIADTLEGLGFKIVKDTFHGYSKLFSMNEIVAVHIGTKMILLNDTKTIGFLIEEIEMACMVQLEKQMQEKLMLEELTADTFVITVTDVTNSPATYEGYITLVNESSVADEAFAEKLEELGYTIEEREVLEGYKETCSCICMGDSVIKFAEVNKQGTLYRNVQLRERVEILYILVCLKYGEAIFADEF